MISLSVISGQIFTATIPAQCSDPNSTIDLGGNYSFSFTPRCRENHEPAEACSVFLSTLTESSGKVVLDVDASFEDDCDADLFAVTFGGALTFYSDDAFAVEADGSSPFVIGQDTIYGKVSVDIPDDPSGARYQFVDVSIENVYVCTAAQSADIALDSSSGLGGCFSPNIDADGPYTVIGSGAVAAYQGSTAYEMAANHEAAFSFLTFSLFLLSLFGNVLAVDCISSDIQQTLRGKPSMSTSSCCSPCSPKRARSEGEGCSNPAAKGMPSGATSKLSLSRPQKKRMMTRFQRRRMVLVE